MLSILSHSPPGAASLLPWQPGQGPVAPWKVQQAEDEASERHRGGDKVGSRHWTPGVNGLYAQVSKNPEVHREMLSKFRHGKGSAVG